MKKLFNRFYLLPAPYWARRLSLWRQGLWTAVDGLVMFLSLGFVGSSFALNCAKRRSRMDLDRLIAARNLKLQK